MFASVIEWLRLLPPWLVVGLGLGAVFSAFVAGVFVVGARLFPDPPVDRERRVDGTTRRRAEIREYLAEVGERFREDATVRGERVAFFLPEREVAITFDPQAYFRLERAGVHAVLCEHEMPGRHLGRRLPFDVPELAPPASDDPVTAAFDRLGLGPDASGEEVRDAYRERVKEAHPDHGGDREEFTALREAYTTAKNHAD